jgi:hypothetical protein
MSITSSSCPYYIMNNAVLWESEAQQRRGIIVPKWPGMPLSVPVGGVWGCSTLQIGLCNVGRLASRWFTGPVVHNLMHIFGPSLSQTTTSQSCGSR